MVTQPNTHYRLASLAYLKILLHAAKYPHKAINGILLSNPTAKKTTESGDGGMEIVEITDIVPLFHVNLNVSIWLEIALEQVFLYASETNQTIVGLYHGNESVELRELSPAGKVVAKKILELTEKETSAGDEGLVLLIDLSKWKNERDRLPIVPLIHHGGSWMPAKSPTTFLQLSFSTSSSLISRLLTRLLPYSSTLYDFDNHMDDIRLDWLVNKDVGTLISSTINSTQI